MDRDLTPSRMSVTKTLLQSFIIEFFDQNPISQLGLIIAIDGLAKRVVDCIGNASSLLEAVRTLPDPFGELSIQNSLELMTQSLV